MATKAKQAKGTLGVKRDITKALEMAKSLQVRVEPALAADAQELVTLLDELDGRRSRRQKAYRAKQA